MTLSTCTGEATTAAADCRHEFFARKYGEKPSPYLTARRDAGYLSPEDHYELLVDRLVATDMTWLDVGCGRSPFPNNQKLAQGVSQRCMKMVGIDPDPAVHENPFIHSGEQTLLDDYTPSAPFDFVTARMVVEHVRSPDDFAAGLARVTKVGSRVVIFTVNWLSITALAAHFTPLSVHNWVKSRLWGTEEKDTFPTVYRMNRRTALRDQLASQGFQEESFSYLADASLFWRLPALRKPELKFWQFTTACRLPYPDTCILAVYRRTK